MLERDAGWTLELLLAKPEVVPRHFPADRHGPPGFSFPEAEFRIRPPGPVGLYGSDGTQARCPDVAFNVLCSYRTLLETLALCVDHHGWVHSRPRQAVLMKLEAASVDFVLPRVLRSLSLLELRGHSSGGPPDRYGYSYAAGLATTLIRLLGLRDERCALGSECLAALRRA